MAGITGIGSGMNISGMVQAMLEAETAPKAAQLQRLEKANDAKLSALGKLQTALGTFKDALKDLNKTELFDNMKATSSDTKALTVSAEKSALGGKYSVEVEQLAASSKVATAAIDTDFTASGAGTLEIKLGAVDENPVTVNIADGATLVEIRDAINQELEDKGISANIVNNPSTGKSQLVLSGKETGADNDIMVTGAGSLSEFTVDGSQKAEGTGAGYLQQAQNAKYSIDGLQQESASNTVKNAIPDVEFTLVGKTEENKPLTVSVGEDRAGVKEQLKKFVSAYNDLIGVTKELTAVTRVGEDKAPVTGGLVGDSTVRSLVNGVRAELSNMAPGGDGLRVLADLGITTDKDGKLKIDDKQLDKALENNFDQVGQFLAGDNGLMSRLDSKISAYAGKDGIIGTRQQSLSAMDADIAKQKERLSARSAQIEARLLKQFNAMDALVGQLSTTSQSLMQSLASLPGMQQ